MQYHQLGKTNLIVSELCFGSLTIGPLQANLDLVQGTAVVERAFSQGVNFIDTAELYETYPYIKGTLKRYPNTIVSSKSYAYTYDAMEKSVHNACKSIGRNYIDIFSLHEQSSRLTLKGHLPALEYLVRAKEQGLVRAIGVSTHTVEVVRAIGLYDEVDIVHPIINERGLGIVDGTTEEMLRAIEFAYDMGKGIYAMKALAGGHLSDCSEQAFRWIRQQKNISAVAVGMQNFSEVDVNVAIFSDKEIDQEKFKQINKQVRNIIVEPYCVGCGICEQYCQGRAIKILSGKAVIDKQRCVRCAYCAAHCPHFCIKVI